MILHPINELIDKWSHSFWIVKRIKNVTCTCVEPSSKTPNPHCKKCLGTGNKIKIIKSYGASREQKEIESFKTGLPTVTPKVYYCKDIVFAERGDYLVDDETIYTVFANQYHRGINGKYQFTRLICPILKMENSSILNNFKEIINEHKRKY